MVENEVKPNIAVAQVAEYIERRGRPFTFRKGNIERFIRRKIRPFSDMLEAMSTFERERIAEGVQVLTFRPGRKFGFTTTGYGR